MVTNLDAFESYASAPDLDQLSRTYAELRNRLMDPGTDVLPVVKQWDRLRRVTMTWQNLVELRFNQDTTDPMAVRQRQQCDEMSPQITELDVSVKRILLEGPHRDQIQQTYGDQVLALWKSETMSFAPEIKESLVDESRLEADYNALLSSAKIDFEGKSYNLEGIDQFRFDPNRTRRYTAMKNKWQWFVENRVELDSLFDKLVHVRNQMAQTLGFDNFIEMAYLRRCRVDYNREDVSNYRQRVVRDVVPYCRQLMLERKSILGIDQLRFWDEAIHSTSGNPRPAGDHDWMIERAFEMFDAMSKPLGDFFRLMVDQKLIDLKNREGKGGGGFCTDFPAAGLPFIFANFNGTADDVRVFTHEMGHAFQGYSSRDQELYDYVWPTYESCEIHSMGLEFMTFPEIDRFFQGAGRQFCREHVIDSLMFLPYGVAVDHFQHLVYDNPAATGNDRMEMWQEMERTYLPWRDYGDLPHVAHGGRWQLQRHIYLYPLYYIDYTLALACAMQLWQSSVNDFAGTLDRYEELCRLGGSRPFRALAESAGIKSPFEDECLQEVVSFARSFLESSVDSA